MSRYALYALPQPGSALEAFGRAVLGYDNVAGTSLPHPPGLEDLAGITAGARRYGFHATLKAPMRLASGIDEAALAAETARLAIARAPMNVGPLAVTALEPFLALVPQTPPAGLALLAAECVAALDPLRALLDETERARRRPDQLSCRERTLLDRWGYPHVFERFRFHMTLTDALPEASLQDWRTRLTQAYAAASTGPLVIDALCLLRQDEGGPFRLIERVPLRGSDDDAP